MYSRVLAIAAIVTMALAVQAANSTANSTAPFGNSTSAQANSSNGTNGTNGTSGGSGSASDSSSSAASLTNFSSGAFVIAMIAVACSVMSL
ncbi:Schizosaccharomyces specific protein [Schizosaccharomyces osmophilus]|uniref:Schizosaccharomyces specific protein n=1 Tax=Schizosaccharomyces osmophilus TaxID=2545709 RepID=A0AAE9WFM5_9SCHI|nr:Schizosaccharomyces specific protein [Schizosaccharomyces osmophilus]WBW75300.1 Schizosaccharomyces specific protein [Schizosaccharomyces osmophilus]